MTDNIPKIRVLVDWDGDGYRNMGATNGGPLNLVNMPLTMNGLHLTFNNYDVTTAVTKGVPFSVTPSRNIPARYEPTDRGLYRWRYSLGVSQANYIGWSDNSISYPLLANLPAGAYTIQFYVRGDTNYSGHQIQFRVGALSTSGAGLDTTRFVQTTTTVTMSGVWQLVTHTFTITAGANVAATGAEVKHSSGAVTMTASVTGFACFAGTYTASTCPAFNIGTVLSTYDNISAYVMSAQWQLGSTQPYDTVASEGTAYIQLRNTTQLFSPESTASFLYKAAAVYGYPYDFPSVKFQEGVVISIEIYDEIAATWVEMWKGFVDTIDIGTGVSDPTATLTAYQGLFKFQKNTLDTTALQNKRADEIIKKAIQSGWITAIVPNQFALGKTQIRDSVSYDVLAVGNSYSIDTGTQIYDFSGESWSSGLTSPVDVIREVMNIEQGLFFLQRNGVIRFMHRDRIYSNMASEPADIVLDGTLYNSVDYQSNQGSTNSVKIEYAPKKTLTGQIWSNKSPFTIKPAQVFTTTVNTENPENSKLTATVVNQVTALVLPSTYTVTDTSGNALPSSYVAITLAVKNGQINIMIRNFTALELQVSMVINGTYVVSYGSISTTRNDLRYQPTVGLKRDTLSSKLITTETQANALGDYILSTRAKRYSTFSSMQILSRDNTWLHNILTTTIGNRVKVGDIATGNVYHRVLVVGENASWTPALLTMNYTLRPADNTPSLVAGSTKVGSEGVLY